MLWRDASTINQIYISVCVCLMKKEKKWLQNLSAENMISYKLYTGSSVLKLLFFNIYSSIINSVTYWDSKSVT